MGGRHRKHLAETSHGLKSGQAVLISLREKQRNAQAFLCGALAQLGERLICIQEVRSSILLGSTTPCPGGLPGNRTGR